MNTPVPTATQATATAQGSSIYYSDGKTLIARVGMARENIPFSEMPPAIRDAVVATENKTFWDDSGISIPGMARSVWMTATGQQLQGASTITQQMARNYYDGLSQDVSIKRKFKEIFVSVKLDQSLTKEKILEQYLNTVNFGRAYGIQAASKAYFNKPAKSLTVEQAAYLAGRIQTPALDADSPQLQSRFKDVINLMAAYDPQKYGKLPATAKFPKSIKFQDTTALSGSKGYMVSVVLDELEKRKISYADIQSNGYKIVTTFNRRLMSAAKSAVLSETRGMSKEFHAGLAAVDPATGRVVAFYGGDNYDKDKWNEPFDSRKQAASAFKPYVLAAWLDAGYSLKSYVPGKETVPKELPGTTPIKNDAGDAGLPSAINVTEATAKSINTAFASMAYALPGQLQDVRTLAEQAGISKDAIDQDENGVGKENGHGYQLAIGSVGVTPVEQAAGYSIFANAGKHADWHVVQSIKQGNLTILPELKTTRQVISPEAAADATTAMEEVLKTGTAGGRGLPDRPSAGKTGTNNDEKEAWFVGFTPQLSTAVGMYREVCKTSKGKIVQPQYSQCPITDGKKNSKYNINKPFSQAYEVSLGFAGATHPTTIWRNFMMAALQGKPVEQFPKPADIGTPHDLLQPPPPPVQKPDPGQQNPGQCQPNDPNCQGGGGGNPGQCQPGDPTCQGGGGGNPGQCQPGDPTCQGGGGGNPGQCQPGDPTCQGTTDPTKPGGGHGGGQQPVTGQALTMRRFSAR
ncbi:transglycosylase domain-containing protein [Planotetraspora thailandica]|nr:transglycosylase domain-containing protein [Planotetraspora thailandica]